MMHLKKESVDVNVDVDTAKEAIDELTRRGYDTAAIYSFACASRSWCKKDSEKWKMWKEVESMTSEKGKEGD